MRHLPPNILPHRSNRRARSFFGVPIRYAAIVVLFVAAFLNAFVGCSTNRLDDGQPPEPTLEPTPEIASSPGPGDTDPPDSTRTPAAGPEDSSTPAPDRDNDGYPADVDCDDTDPAIYPSARETCDELDNDCDDTIDEGVTTTYYPDVDNDGFGDSAAGTDACTPPKGYVAIPGDCLNTDPHVFPGAVELCNGVDDDCDSSVDEGVTNTYHPDSDGDGYGDSSQSTDVCTRPAGYVVQGGDCLDSDPAVHPGAEEVCNGMDDDCDGTVDEEAGETCYLDRDDDGFGDTGAPSVACTCPEGYSDVAGDCNDLLGGVYPGANESCNGVDDDCDKLYDEGVTKIYYRDDDEDGYGVRYNTWQACWPPDGYTAQDGDCNDWDDEVYPGALEVCYDGTRQDCSGAIDDDCQPTGYSFDAPPDCDEGCYPDEFHNVAVNGSGQESNNEGFDQCASGQLIDGLRGVDDHHADLGLGPGYEWVGWKGQDPGISFWFGGIRTVERLTIGLSNDAADLAGGSGEEEEDCEKSEGEGRKKSGGEGGEKAGDERGVKSEGEGCEKAGDEGCEKADGQLGEKRSEAGGDERGGTPDEEGCNGGRGAAADSTGEAVAMPETIRVSLSDDGVTYHTELEFCLAEGDFEPIPDGKRGDITLDVPETTAKLIRLELVHAGDWTLVDEVEIR